MFTYLRNKDKASCNLREKPFNCLLAESSSADSDRFLFPGAVEEMVELFCRRTESPLRVAIAGGAAL
jgi:hypothetical protein